MSVWLELEADRPGTPAFVAVINTGYEARSPQRIVPIEIARSLGFWPPPAW